MGVGSLLWIFFQCSCVSHAYQTQAQSIRHQRVLEARYPHLGGGGVALNELNMYIEPKTDL